MSDHPHVPYDEALLDVVADSMTLRTPNFEALQKVAECFDDANGEPFEAVCNLATAVGKTYLAGGVIEYLASQGVRNFLVVVPGSTIRNKTIDNFTAGHAKSILGGMSIDPLVVTIDNFATGAVGAAMEDDSTVKLFVFTVQSLIQPKKNDRRVRKTQEWLGADLYGFLQAADDLVILADEHHVYSDSAVAFSAAVRDLDAMAIIGLTATPHPADKDKIIYHYPLARAIADRYVKTPVLVGRRDSETGVETRLRDGMLLLEAKQKAADLYAEATGKARVNAVMFIVAESIDGAKHVAETLRKPGLFPDNYDEAVLTIHSESADEALERLAAAEEPDSTVRVIVSVSMLKEGWDVKNIFVICSLRPSVSDALTEQTLGRGLRLPWGEYTDVELLDTVEVLSHESYRALLKRAEVLLEGIAGNRANADVAAVQIIEAAASAAATVSVQAAPDSRAGDASASPASQTNEVSEDPGTPELPEGSTGFVVSEFGARTEAADAQIEALRHDPTPKFTFKVPVVTRTVTAYNFELSSIADASFGDLGRKLSSTDPATLERKVLHVSLNPDGSGGLLLEPRDATDTYQASVQTSMSFGDIEDQLYRAILGLDIVDTGTKTSFGAARRLAKAVVTGAGSPEALGPYLSEAINGCRILVNSAHRAAPEVASNTVVPGTFGPSRPNSKEVDRNRFGAFSTKKAYAGWGKSMHELNWFDSEPERAFANLVDGDTEVVRWARIQRHESFRVEWAEGIYTPDFLVELADGPFLVVEVKADRDIETDAVQKRRQASEEWARYVNDTGTYDTWVYVLVPTKVLDTAKTVKTVLAHTVGV